MNNKDLKKIIDEKVPDFEYKEDLIDEIDCFSDTSEKIHYIPEDKKFINYTIKDITIVDGSFEVAGLLDEAKSQSSLFIVLGDLTVDRAIITSSIYVMGNFTIKNIAVFDSMGDWTLTVEGDLKAKYYVESDHCLRLKGIFFAEKSYERGADSRNLLVPECIYEEKYHDFGSISNRIIDNLSVFI